MGYCKFESCPDYKKNIYENNITNNNCMGNTKKNNRKTNPKVHERKMMITFFTLGIIAYVGLFVMGCVQKIIQLFKTK